MKIRKPYTLSVQRIKIRSFQNRISMTTQIAVPLVVSYDQNNIGTLVGKRISTK
jgi:hypothetical protein